MFLSPCPLFTPANSPSREVDGSHLHLTGDEKSAKRLLHLYLVVFNGVISHGVTVTVFTPLSSMVTASSSPIPGALVGAQVPGIADRMPR
jgi:hypothetical protein